VRDDTRGSIEQVDARYELLRRGAYTLSVDRSSPVIMSKEPGIPLDLEEAHNAVRIALAAGAADYAKDTIDRAIAELRNANGFYSTQKDQKQMITVAREATQHAEDARLISLRKQKSEEAVRTAADAQTAQEAAAQAEAGRQRALQDAQDAKGLYEQSQAQGLRSDLQQQLSSVLDTRTSAHGFVMTVPDGMFDPGRDTLTPPARERLARLSGLLLAYPSLRLDIASDPGLPQKRADAVRAYLVNQGLSPVTASRGSVGASRPAGVEITVSGADASRQQRSGLNQTTR